jgi:hypothetical protein
MRIAQLTNAGALVFCLAQPSASPAAAAERALTGAWIQGVEQCGEVFTWAGSSVSFKKPVNAFAPAFIISGNQVRTPQASCRIKGAKRSGDRRILALACATSIAIDEVPASLEPLADGTLRRYLNDQDRTGSKYERCPSPATR